VRAFVESPNWSETTERFDRMAAAIESLTDDNLASITTGYAENDQLYTAVYLNNQNGRLRKFLKKTTGRNFEITGRNIVEAKAIRAAANDADDTPF
jgi:hypothetical protein